MTQYVLHIAHEPAVTVSQVVQNLCDEESFALSAVKDETSTYHLLLRCQSPVQTTPLSIAGRNSYRLDSSLDLS